MKREEWQRYRRQAEHTLASAQRDLDGGDFDWASFKAHQAAELAVKGFIRATREYVTGHSLLKLMASMQDVPAAIRECARELDKVYIPARYPDAYDAGAPMDYYRAPDARRSIDCAHHVIAWLDALAAG